ncbi:MAG: tripartite tricarboxylate transporter permease [Pontibacterium sp.]
MIDVFTSALYTVLSFDHLIFLCVGVILGLAVGIFPGLGGIAGLSLLLPFIYGMDVTSALAMLIGLVAVIPTSDTFTSVLMGIPGSSGSQATVIDGFPLAKKGQAARALSAAFSASLFGGLVGAIVLTALVLIARPVILAFGSAELFMLTLLGLSMVGGLAGNSLPKGLAACCLGLLLGTIGGAPATGEFRLYFGIEYLMDGLPLVVVGLGIFAIPEIVELLRQNRSIAKASNLGGGWAAGVKDLIANKWLALRCSGIGCVIGALPGLGGSVVDWIAYGHAVQSSKDKTQFGQGDIRGVIAPESSNNAKEGGALVPTVLFGIPGSGGMAVFLGGMILIGLEPGPSMVSTNIDVTYTIIWSLALANVLGAGACLAISKWVARLTTVPYPILAPFMITVICFAAFQATRDIGDLVALLAVGVFGVYLKRFGWPRPAFLIGYVLASGMENYLYQAVQFDGWAFLLKPGVVIIGVITLLSIGVSARQISLKGKSQESLVQTKLAPQLSFTLIAFGLGAYGLYDAMQVSSLARIFPLGIAITLMILTAVLALAFVKAKGGTSSSYDEESQKAYGWESPIIYLVWIGSFVVGNYLIGFQLSVCLFFLLFLRTKASLSWFVSGCLGIAVAFAISLLSYYMVLELPSGLLFTWFSEISLLG